MELVSIIVPIYNTQNYLAKCVNSLIEQTYKNIEIILVDDGSTDDSGKICDGFAKNDTRIKVIHKENEGAAFARKSGIEVADGDYIMTVDGDDWVDLETVEKCVSRIKKTQADCVMFSYVKEYPNSSIPMHIMDGDKSLTDHDAEDKVYRRLFGLLDEELAHPERMENVVSCCLKLYKREFAKNGRYFDMEEIGSSEDALFNMYALCGARKIEYIDKPYYHYFKNPYSITNAFRPNLPKQWARLFDIMESIIDEKQLGERYRFALNNRIAMSVVGIGANELCNTAVSELTHIKNINKYLKSDKYKSAIKNFPFKHLPFIWKIFMCCCKMRIGFLVYIQLKAMQYLKKRG